MVFDTPKQRLTVRAGDDEDQRDREASDPPNPLKRLLCCSSSSSTLIWEALLVTPSRDQQSFSAALTSEPSGRSKGTFSAL